MSNKVKVTLTVEIELDLNTIAMNQRSVYDSIPGVNLTNGKTLRDIIEPVLRDNGVDFAPVPEGHCPYCGSPQCIALDGYGICG